MRSPPAVAAQFSRRRRRRYALQLCLLLLPPLLLAPPSTAAQGCLEFVGLLADWRTDPADTPATRRALGVDTILWRGKEMLLLNDGTGLRIWDIRYPLTPRPIAFKQFVCYGGCPATPPVNHDLVHLNFSVCDDCRYGVAQLWEAGTVLFDLGDRQTPSFVAIELYPASAGIEGAFTFRHGGQQYLISNQLLDTCGAGNDAGPAALYLLDGITAGDIIPLQCLETGPGVSPSISNGLYLSGPAGQGYVYLIDRISGRVQVFAIEGEGSDLRLRFQGQPMAAYARYGTGLRADTVHNLLVSAVAGEPVRLFDVSDPGQPAMLDTDFGGYLDGEDSVGSASITRAAIRYPLLWLGSDATLETFTFDISDPSHPVPADQEFWSRQEEWNSYAELANSDAELSHDGSALYLARSSVLELISNETCALQLPPTAELELSPAAVYPGDTVTVTSRSGGVVEAAAIWITDAIGVLVAGSEAPQPAIDSLPFTVPPDVAANQSYTAHVAVENSDNPFDPEAPGDQQASRDIVLDRQPAVTISIVQEAGITGDTLILQALAAGHPAAISWQVTPSEAAPWQDDGEQISVEISDSGAWRFDLVAEYLHQAAAGGLYTVAVTMNRTFSSVAADFTISPTSPCLDETITLDAGTSRSQVGADLAYSWEVTEISPLGTRTQTLAGGPVVELPAGFLEPDTNSIEVTLTLRNQDNGDESVATRQEQVHSCAPVLTITAGNPTPDIGQLVIFFINGAPGSIDEARWDFGGPGCPPYRQQVVCRPDFLSCENEFHKYASAGIKSVTVEVLVNGSWYAAGPVHVSVQDQGSCEISSCTYTVEPRTSSFNRQGGTGAFAVTADASDCSWIATSAQQWIQVVDGSGVGNGTVRFTVEANTTGVTRVGRISIDGTTHYVSQTPNNEVSTSFSVSISNPDIGEEVVFIANPGITPIRWEMGGAGCDSDETTVDCASPALCRNLSWAYRQAGEKRVRLVAAEGTATRSVLVGSGGSCACTATGPPEASFEVWPTPALVGRPVTFSDSTPGGADTWLWEITRSGLTIATSDQPSFSHTFAEVGVYQVRLVASNCAGPGAALRSLEVIEPYDLVVPAAAHLAEWHSDLMVHNPTGRDLAIDLQLLPDVGSGRSPASSISLAPHATELVADVLAARLGATGNVKGGLLLTLRQGSTLPIVTSRISHTTSAGSYGQGMPALPATGNDNGTIYLVGLRHNHAYRTNLGLANPSETAATGVAVRVISPAGSIKGVYEADVPGLATRHLLRVPELCGVTTDLDLFTLEVDRGSNQLLVYASVIDLLTGDPETVTQPEYGANQVLVTGLARQPGANGSLWLSDVTLFNPTDRRLDATLYLYAFDLVRAGFQVTLEPRETRCYTDISGWLLNPTAQGRGYLRVVGGNGAPAPIVAARTYTEAEEGGTYGQSLVVSPDNELIGVGERGYLPGLQNLPAAVPGHRTNLGLVTLAEDVTTSIKGTFFDQQGGEAATRWLTVPAGELYQLNLFDTLGLAGDEVAGSLELEVVAGGPVAAYASRIDNGTNDPVLTRCQRVR